MYTLYFSFDLVDIVLKSRPPVFALSRSSIDAKDRQGRARQAMRRLQAKVSPIMRVDRFAMFFFAGSRRLTNAVPFGWRYIIRPYRSQRD